MPLQRSFSDTNHSTKRRSHWQRNKSYQAPQSRHDLGPSEAPRGKPLVPISSATKNKLDVFQFNAQGKNKSSSGEMSGSRAHPHVLEEDKENAPLNVSQEDTNHHPQFEHIKSSIELPATPSTKLGLPELIGMIDVGSMTQLQLKTPDDRVMWDHGINATDSSTASYVTPRRGKKRARSSSPMSSPANPSSHFSVNAEAAGIQQLGTNTPNAGPEIDLWSGYAVGTSKRTPRAPQNPLFAHLMGNCSSPQSASSNKAGLREGAFNRSITRSDRKSVV